MEEEEVGLLEEGGDGGSSKRRGSRDTKKKKDDTNSDYRFHWTDVFVTIFFTLFTLHRIIFDWNLANAPFTAGGVVFELATINNGWTYNDTGVYACLNGDECMRYACEIYREHYPNDAEVGLVINPEEGTCSPSKDRSFSWASKMVVTSFLTFIVYLIILFYFKVSLRHRKGTTSQRVILILFLLLLKMPILVALMLHVTYFCTNTSVGTNLYIAEMTICILFGLGYMIDSIWNLCMIFLPPLTYTKKRRTTTMSASICKK